MSKQKLWDAIKTAKRIIEDEIYSENDSLIKEGLQKAFDILDEQTNPRNFIRKLDCGCLLEGGYIREYIGPDKHEDWCPDCHRRERKWAWDNHHETIWARHSREALEIHCNSRQIEEKS